MSEEKFGQFDDLQINSELRAIIALYNNLKESLQKTPDDQSALSAYEYLNEKLPGIRDELHGIHLAAYALAYGRSTGQEIP